jgi:cytochrome o ubiquinol oxidase operon protein cyoD
VNDRSLSLGFLGCFVLTMSAYLLVVTHALPTPLIVAMILLLAFIQFTVQLFVFLHLGHGSRWKRLMFVAMVFIVIVVVAGSIWIMHNLNYNMMNMSTSQKSTYMRNHEGL